ncbi:hypothetical protein niasHT_021341 [Heterodera trifolii]|uniref:Uncharacterized protein n=1 Tax=Heterodera trifolii TaxID=157864 RepID=A0ABD2K6G8_9BILA
MKECVTDFSILRIFYETANFILQNAYMANFEERAERLAAFWSQFSKHSKPPQIGISTFQKKESEIKILYANNFHILNTKTGEVLLKLLKANISGRILQKNKLPTFENCDEIADELGKIKWLENAVMDESNGLNMKGIYENILEEFDNRRHNQYSAERSFGMACSTEFFKLHSLNYLSQFVLRQIVQSALTSEANFMYKIFQTEMKHLYEELHIFLREHFGTVVGQIGISSREKGNDEIGDGETDGDEEDTTGESDEDSDGDEQQQKQQQNQAVPAQAPRYHNQHERNDDGHGHGGRGKAEESAVGEEQPRGQCQDELKHPKQIGEAALSEQRLGAVTEPTEAAAAAADREGNGGGGGGKIGDVQHGHNHHEVGDHGRDEDTSDEDEVYHDMDEDQFEEEEKEEEEEMTDEKHQNPEN